jgi:hypothetical protein
LVKLKSSLRQFYGRHHDLVDRYGISVSQIIWEIYTPYAVAVGMLLHINGKFTMEKLISSLLS